MSLSLVQCSSKYRLALAPQRIERLQRFPDASKRRSPLMLLPDLTSYTSASLGDDYLPVGQLLRAGVKVKSIVPATKAMRSFDHIWELIERISQPILRVDHELREGYFGPLGYIFPK